MIIMKYSFASYCPQNPVVNKYHFHNHLLLAEPLYQYRRYVEYVTDTVYIYSI
jgi:hypothetical protein